MHQLARVASAAVTLGLCCVLTACSGAADPAGPSAAPSTASAASSATITTQPPTTTSTTSTSTTSTEPGASTTTTSPSAPVIDQSSPEGAMTAWLGSMVSGDSKAVCALMASNGKPISEIKGAQQSCAATVAPTVKELSKVRSAFAGLRISGATTKGDAATFESATTTPALAAKVVSGLKAVKIGAKWFITP